ncbi:two-component sensor histidine kinase [Actinorhabdospora filicis]|uniref:histidine kinase n=1 Tax=Actinorhabdospora filicis TaxID=1785913 RepID=A0A9W6W7S4_9ACTN|nr:HAMP domain-containing sensor histidine kinase [Actinorhabdospora filicis]GLZ75786.1 two-component sensor histidine kinase [Actinorhabdospora filicis]
MSQRMSLRARVVVIGVLGLTLTLGVGGFTLVSVLQSSLLGSVDTGIDQTGKEIAGMIRTGRLPDLIPSSGNTIIQVLRADYTIDRVSAGGDRLVTVLRPDEIGSALARGEKLTVRADQATYEGFLRVGAVAAADRIVLVAVPLAEMQHNVHYFKTGLFILIPVLIVVLGLAIWYVVGMALRPVETLRRSAEDVRGGERLVVPHGGEDEIHRLAVTLNTMLERLERARDKQRSFVADAAHELRSPLANMRTELEVAARIGPTPELLDDLLSDVERLGRLTDDLLLLARADDPERLRLKKERVDVGDLLTAICQRYTGSRVPVTCVPPPEDAPLWVDGDVDGLRRAISNLVDNAVRHAATRVVVSADAHPDGVRVSVTDDGEGVPVSDRARVFERFTRLDGARSRDKGGTGLGLAIVRELVARHGGTVTLHDAAPGRTPPGLRADVVLPRPK